MSARSGRLPDRTNRVRSPAHQRSTHRATKPSEPEGSARRQRPSLLSGEARDFATSDCRSAAPAVPTTRSRGWLRSRLRLPADRQRALPRRGSADRRYGRWRNAAPLRQSRRRSTPWPTLPTTAWIRSFRTSQSRNDRLQGAVQSAGHFER